MTAVPAPMLRLSNAVNGVVEIPQFGFGTYRVPPEEAERVVSEALEAGYRHIDTAQMYGNEAGVGRALAASGIDRDELFVTSKLDNGNHGHDDALRSLDRSLTELGLERLDLFLVHWPMAAVTNIVETWRTMIEILQSGRVRAIGVSNHQAEHLREITDATGIAPAVNQIEISPYLTQEPLRALHAQMGIVTPRPGRRWPAARSPATRRSWRSATSWAARPPRSSCAGTSSAATSSSPSRCTASASSRTRSCSTSRSRQPRWTR